jgi:tRNA threonylcarbamoyladenosine biosynthesis protein TsaB
MRRRLNVTQRQWSSGFGQPRSARGPDSNDDSLWLTFIDRGSHNYHSETRIPLDSWEADVRILALETSCREASVALFDGGTLVSEIDLDPQRRTTQALLPAVDQQLREAGWQPQDLSLVAVSHGPGSFTGLRVGVTAAKTLAYAVEAEVLGVDTLWAIAAQSALDCPTLWAVTDAQRNEVFCARFASRKDAPPRCLGATHITANEAWIRQLEPGEGVTGSGLKRLAPQLPESVGMEQEIRWRPRAATIARLAWLRYQEGHRGDLWRLTPQYLRRSAAEEKYADRGGT